MTTGINSAGVDLDALFKARTSTKIADVGWRSNGGVDISNRFEPRGATTARANTSLRSAGTDLAQLFKDISIADALAASVPSSTSKFGSTSTIVSNPITCTASGGTGSYTYSWVRLTGGITADSPTSATTTFRATGLSAGSGTDSDFKCTVSDGATSVDSNVIAVHLERTGG